MTLGNAPIGNHAVGSSDTTDDSLEAIPATCQYSPSKADFTVKQKTLVAEPANYTYTPSQISFTVTNKTLIAEPANYQYSINLAESDLLLAPRDEIAVLINNNKIESYQGVKVEKRLNEVNTFEFTAFITEEEQRGLISEGQEALFVENGELFFKGRMEDVSYDSTFQATCEGEGMETSLLDRKTDRDQYDNVHANEIITDLAEPTPVEIGDIDEAPLTSLAFDHDNRARAIAGAANAVGYDWQISQKLEDGYETDYIDFKERIGSEESVYEFILGETARFVDDETDDGFVANDITLLGRGDGINQLEARVFAAAEDFTQLSSEVGEDLSVGSTISVDDATIIGSTSDEIITRIGVELVKAEIIDSTTLEIIDRGVENWKDEETPIIAHRENISVWLYENITQNLGPYTPESRETSQQDSSINDKGVKQLRETDKTIVNLSTLEQVADRELRNRYKDVKSIEIRPTNPRIENEVSLGDQVHIDDGDGQLDGEYRVVGKDITRRSSGEGTVLHCANRPRRMVERLSEIERDTDTLNAHMQGATNIDSQSFRDNCDTSNSLSTNVYIPEDAVAVNKVDLVFERLPFRGYVQNEDHSHEVTVELGDHSHTIDIPDHDHVVDIPNHSHAMFQVNSDPTGWIDPDNLVPMQTRIWNDSTGTRFEEIWIGDFDDSFNSEDELRTLEEELHASTTSEEGGGFVESTKNSSSTVNTATADAGGSPTYGIFEQSGEPDTDIDVLVDGDIVETVENVSVGQEINEPIRLEDHLDDPVAGRRHKIELRPGTLTRLHADIVKKIYVESTV